MQSKRGHLNLGQETGSSRHKQEKKKLCALKCQHPRKLWREIERIKESGNYLNLETEFKRLWKMIYPTLLECLEQSRREMQRGLKNWKKLWKMKETRASIIINELWTVLLNNIVGEWGKNSCHSNHDSAELRKKYWEESWCIGLSCCHLISSEHHQIQLIQKLADYKY